MPVFIKPVFLGLIQSPLMWTKTPTDVQWIGLSMSKSLLVSVCAIDGTKTSKTPGAKEGAQVLFTFYFCRILCHSFSYRGVTQVFPLRRTISASSSEGPQHTDLRQHYNPAQTCQAPHSKATQNTEPWWEVLTLHASAVHNDKSW